MTFDEAFEALIGHEGGYVNDPRDPGGETKYGISRRAYPGEDIAHLTLERAKQIYLRDYWAPAGCDAVPDALRMDLFDMAVNSGVKPAIRCLQSACGETQDGVLGPRTIQAASSMPPARLLARFNGRRLAMLTDLPTWPAFGKGWARRIADNLTRA
ncbi:MAG TPA: glycosyl hydrolase 108 family protein [Rubrivivax sp.]|nr:glycosyl hydrolase 108 family protein [Rubrivivax sp.]